MISFHARFVTRLMLGTFVPALTVLGAYGQTATEPSVRSQDVESIVVTGTSIRGAAPIGSNLITIDRGVIEQSGTQTVQQLLAQAPQISGSFGSAGQGKQNQDGAGGYSPSIHSLGGSVSQATLILINGHRIPASGLTVVDVDPTAVPTAMLQRVDVLPDGASSVYGSDAIAGVINFITRRDFDGIETNIQAGIANRYQSFDASAIFGHNWGTGSATLAYEYSSRSALMNGDRSFITSREDIRLGAANPSAFVGVPVAGPTGSMTVTPTAGAGTTGPFGVTIPYPSIGVNYQTFNCPIASISTSSSAAAYYYPYNGSPFSVSTSAVPSQGACDSFNSNSILPSEVRNNVMVSLRQDLGDRLSVNADLYYATRVGTNRVTAGQISGTAFGPTYTSAVSGTSQINPFFVGNATTGTTSEYIRYDFDQLLGQAYLKTLSQNAFTTVDIRYDLGDEREIVISGSAGQNFNKARQINTLCSACALLALNGTTNTSGNPSTNSESDIYGLGTTYVGNRKLTPANALDVWSPIGSNKTSKAVLASLRDGGFFQSTDQGLQDIIAKVDGPIFNLPAGPVRASAGVEFLHSTLDENGTTNGAVGPTGSNSSTFYYNFGRQVYSAFLEFIVPIISPNAQIPLLKSFEIDVSGRYDKFSRLGDTKNPKIGMNWQIDDALRARGSYSTSFMAPDLHNLENANSQSVVLAAPTPDNPVILFGVPNTYNGGAGTAGTFVANAASCAAGNATPVNAAGSAVAAPYTGAVGCKVSFGATNAAGQSAALRYQGANPNLKPATGVSYSFGLDLNAGNWFQFLDGFRASVTYYDVKYQGFITSSGTQTSRPDLTTFAPPGGFSPTDPFIQSIIAGRPIQIALPSQIYAVFDGRLQNAYTVWQNGLDFDVRYLFKSESNGTFTAGIAGNQILRFSQKGGFLSPVDVKNGKNGGRFAGVELTAVASLGWNYENLSTGVLVNYTHPYNIPVSAFPYNFAGSDRAANSGRVGAFVTTDVTVSYNIPKNWLGLPSVLSEGSQISLVMQNILDTDPPYFAAASGSPGFGNSALSAGQANPIGRLITLGWRKTW